MARLNYPRVIQGDFICTECRDKTDYLKLYFEDYGEERIDCECGCGGVYDNAVTCVYCGEDIPESRAKLDNDGEYACEECFNEAEGESA